MYRLLLLGSWHTFNNHHRSFNVVVLGYTRPVCNTVPEYALE